MQNIFLQDIKLLQNKVLVEVVGKYDTNVKLGDTTIEVDKNYEKEKFIATSGIVRAVPAKLTFGKSPDDMTWVTPMQLKVNDKVVMSFMAIAAAISDKGTSFTEDGKTYAFVHYRDLVYATRNSEDIMLNGYCLVQPILEDDVPGFKAASKLQIRSKFSSKYGKVIACGEPVYQYAEDNDYDDPSIKVGDIVSFPPIAGIQVYKSSSDLMFKRNVFLKIQRRRMLCVLEKV